MRELADVMSKKDWFTNEKDCAVIDKAVDEGFVRRPSVSQSEWTEKGIAFLKAETEGIYLMSIAINKDDLVVEESTKFDVLKVSKDKIVIDNDSIDYISLYGSDIDYSNGVDTSRECESYARKYGNEVEIKGYFTDETKGKKILKDKMKAIINEKIKVHEIESNKESEKLNKLKNIANEK